MFYKIFIATICSVIAFSCFLTIIFGMSGIIDLSYFSIGQESGIKVLGYISVACLLFVAALYHDH